MTVRRQSPAPILDRNSVVCRYRLTVWLLICERIIEQTGSSIPVSEAMDWNEPMASVTSSSMDEAFLMSP